MTIELAVDNIEATATKNTLKKRTRTKRKIVPEVKLTRNTMILILLSMGRLMRSRKYSWRLYNALFKIEGIDELPFSETPLIATMCAFLDSLKEILNEPRFGIKGDISSFLESSLLLLCRISGVSGMENGIGRNPELERLNVAEVYDSILMTITQELSEIQTMWCINQLGEFMEQEEFFLVESVCQY